MPDKSVRIEQVHEEVFLVTLRFGDKAGADRQNASRIHVAEFGVISGQAGRWKIHGDGIS